MTRLIIWRHGQTEWNSSDRVQGHIDVGLNEVGIAQAAASAVVLAKLQPDLLIASDLRRAADTAGALAAETGLPVSFDQRLREQHFGTWEGMTAAEIAAAHPEDNARWRRGETITGFDIETRVDLAKRVGEAVRDAVAQVADGTVVIATHGGAGKIAVGEMLGWPTELLWKLGGLSNACWADLRLDRIRGWVLSAYNVGGLTS